MPWNERTLALPPSPPSVRVARRWVAEVLEEVGRPELVESAQLGVTELVTNALLHARPPVTVRVRGTIDHPRVEVTDHSLLPPQRTGSGEQLVTFGRGLDLVASHANRWGSDINLYGTGKTVWFEPVKDPHPADEVESLQFSMEEALAALGEETEPAHRMRIRLLDMPVQHFARLRVHFNELGREARIWALTEPERHPGAQELTEIFLDAERQRRQAAGVDQLDRAIAEGVEYADLDYWVTPDSPDTMARLGRVLELVYDSPDERGLLPSTRPKDPLLLELQRWYLNEFVRQGRGEAPMPWTRMAAARQRRTG